jgi:hypothetical protein
VLPFPAKETDRPTFETVIEPASALTSQEKLRLILRLAPQIEDPAGVEPKNPFRSLLGICANLGSAPSEEDFAEARREMSINFPRLDAV